MSIVDTSQSGTPFLQTLQMLANPEEVQRRFQALMDKQAEVENLLALVGPANDILAMRDSINSDLAEARAVKEVAQAEAERLVAAAQASADAVEEAAAKELDTAKAAAQALREEAQAVLTAANEMRAALERQQAILNDKMIEVNDQIVRNKRLADEHEDAKHGFERSLASLRDIAGQFSTVLGKF